MTTLELNKEDFIRGWEAAMDNNVSVPPQQYWYEQGVDYAYHMSSTNDPEEVFNSIEK